MDYTNQEFAEAANALFDYGPEGVIRGLLNKDKYIQEIAQRAEQMGMKDEIEEIANQPRYILKEEFPVYDESGSLIGIKPLDCILEKEGISFDADYFLTLNGERIAYAGEQIIPLKGKKDQLKKVLGKIAETRRELSYPAEVYDLPMHADEVDGYFDPDTEKWIYPEAFVQANKAAYRFGEFWQNLEQKATTTAKPTAAKIEDPFVQTLINLDRTPEFDPEEEKRQMRYERELEQTQIKCKLLEELEHTNVYNKKRLGIVPTTEVRMNPGYEEFFHNHLGDYSRPSIYKALKDLENELADGNKLKVSALRNEFEKKEGISRKKKLGLLALALFGSASAIYVADQLTKDRKPPTIKNLKYEPTRIENDKVYDAKISFTVEDEEPALNIFGYRLPFYKARVSNATLEFVPAVYAHLPREAFPNETAKVYHLIPLDGKFDGAVEEFAANISDIIGGREYDIKVIAKDNSGNVGNRSLTTPYIREFENLGKLLYDKGIIVSAILEPWNFTTVPMGGDEPLLGRYDSSDDIVQWKKIDWGTGHGINVFFVDGGFWEDFKINGREGKTLNGLLDKGMMSAIVWGWDWSVYFNRGSDNNTLPTWVVDLSSTYNKNKMIELFYEISKWKIFNHPLYLKIEGKPVIHINDEIALIKEDVFKEVKENFEKLRGCSPYLIADTICKIPSLPDDKDIKYLISVKNMKYFDALTGSVGFLNNMESKYVDRYDEYLERHLIVWSQFVKNENKTLVNSIIPGFDNSYSWGSKDQFPLGRNLEAFYNRIKNSFKFTKFIRVDTDNDWGEETHTEPSKNEGFIYFQKLKEAIYEFLNKE